MAKGYAGAVVMASLLALAGRADAQSRDQEQQASGVTLQQSLDGVDEEARSLFEAGRTAFSHGRFDDALEHFTRAHELSGRHELIFNIAVCLDRLRRDAEAAAAFRSYLDEMPDAENRGEVEGRIAQLEHSGAQHTGAGRDRGDAGSSSSSVLPVLGWTSAGLAAASIAASIAAWVAANGEYSRLEEMCLPGGCPADVVHDSSVATLDALTNIFAISAIVLGVASGVMWTLHLATSHDGGDVDVDVAIGPGGVLVRGRL